MAGLIFLYRPRLCLLNQLLKAKRYQVVMRYGRIKVIDMDVDNPGPLAGVRVLDLTDAEITAMEQAGLLHPAERPPRAPAREPES
jgi:hypothetical protein